VYTDRIVGRRAAPNDGVVVTKEVVSGKVRPDGTVLLDDGKTIVPLENCRIAAKTIVLD
jgi:ABC-type uncharacterized transport system ATPase subunit